MKTRQEATPLQRARRWCAHQYSQRRADRFGEHPSHLASEILTEAESRYDLDTFGVEGFCSDCGRCGCSYLNAGDTYDETILFFSETERFRLGCWGDYPERYDN